MLPLVVEFNAQDFRYPAYGSDSFAIHLRSGLTTFVGPNGSGKTQLLYAMRNKLRGSLGQHEVRFVSAGRLGAIESSRSAINGHEGDRDGEAHVGNANWGGFRKQSETIVGDFMALAERVDLRLKVSARIESLFQKRLSLRWSQGGLQIEFASLDGVPYGAGKEASGLVHLTALLAALYDDDVKALLIDEPEVSLHPQLQAFLLDEIRQVAGNPSARSKKLVVISTHSPSMVSARRVEDLSSMVFFRGPSKTPVQVSHTEGLFLGGAVAQFMAGLGEVHRLAFFSRRVLLVEGPSDEMIVNALTDIARRPIAAAGVQVVPVNGKAAMPVVAKFFRAIGKEVFVLADLDAFVDSNVLMNVARDMGNIQEVIEQRGHASLHDFDKVVRERLSTLVEKRWSEIEKMAQQHPYYASTSDPVLAKRRATLATLLGMSDSALGSLPSSADWRGLRAQWSSLLDALASVGCVALRRGAIESYFEDAPSYATAKPEAASKEIARMLGESPSVVSERYADVLRAIDAAGQVKPIDEAVFLRRALGAVVGAATVNLHEAMSDAELAAAIADGSPDYSKMFSVTNASTPGTMAVHVDIRSSLFTGYPFPILCRADSPVSALEQSLPSPRK